MSPIPVSPCMTVLILDKTGLPLFESTSTPTLANTITGRMYRGAFNPCIPLHDCANTRQDSNTIQLFKSSQHPHSPTRLITPHRWLLITHYLDDHPLDAIGLVYHFRVSSIPHILTEGSSIGEHDLTSPWLVSADCSDTI